MHMRLHLTSAPVSSGRITHRACLNSGPSLSGGRSQAEQPLTCSMTMPVSPNRPTFDIPPSRVPLLALYGLAGVGLMRTLAAAASGLKFAWRQYLRPAKDLSKYGKWAIVTGASGGIGRAYCDYLAKQGALLTTTQTRPATTWSRSPHSDEHHVLMSLISPICRPEHLPNLSLPVQARASCNRNFNRARRHHHLPRS